MCDKKVHMSPPYFQPTKLMLRGSIVKFCLILRRGIARRHCVAIHGGPKNKSRLSMPPQAMRSEGYYVFALFRCPVFPSSVPLIRRAGVERASSLHTRYGGDII